MATNSLADLTAVLTEKVRMLESMREALEEEQRCIIEARAERLDENTRKALEFVSSLNLLNSRFRALLLSTGSELGLSECNSLSSLITGVDPETGTKFRFLQKKCFSAVEAINRLLVMNEGLVRNSLKIIDSSISLFSRLLGGCETYGAAGRILNGKAQAGILCREI